MSELRSAHPAGSDTATLRPPLHPTPPPRVVLGEQVRAVGHALRWPAAAAATLVALVTLLFTGAVLEGAVMYFRPERWLLPGLVGLLLPMAVWRGEERFGSAFLWTLPVDRRRHALAKVFAGWAWLMGAVALFWLWLLALVLVSDGAVLGEETLRLLPASAPLPSPGTLEPGDVQTIRSGAQLVFWLVPFTAATGTYLLASALTLGTRRPLRWIVGTLLGAFVLTFVGELTGSAWLSAEPLRLLRSLVSGRYGLDTLLTGGTEFLKYETTLTTGEPVALWRGLPDPARWASGTLLWLAVGLLALWLAASRHRERRSP